ncbi:HpcH/HpaI aldolase/citrate lyase family protein [Novosphingobium album (ex Liu et al. 2023)]|uniref:CoA ester lyase n=1 Tax=Novosphingobium album (ex Liu et al. 2023) TaxID=3031130 RepID=A0ABT5WT85_9SPHN|nr:CoA ester lyase [Novosphingobium album (ex Liu et al. 2023)]MDE8652393.1 CoA ester lyase [Novosphingobium album (ex Liu et al. 2023)]
MKYRSWLIVPGNREERLGSAVGLHADVIVVDLEATVPVPLKPAARAIAADWLHVHRTHVLEQRRIGRWVRINPLDSGLARDDLIAVMPHAPDGIVLPRATGPEAVSQLAAEIYELEHRHGLPTGSTLIVPVVGETARAAVTIPAYLDSGHQRLAGLTWGASNLAAALGLPRAHDVTGAWGETFRHVRAQALLTAHACSIMAIEALHTDTLEDTAIARAAGKARTDGFTGMLVSHPDQVAAINAAFTPSRAEIAEARDIVEAFSASPNADALPYKGRVIDRPHLGAARRTLQMTERAPHDDARRLAVLRPA